MPGLGSRTVGIIKLPSTITILQQLQTIMFAVIKGLIKQYHSLFIQKIACSFKMKFMLYNKL